MHVCLYIDTQQACGKAWSPGALGPCLEMPKSCELRGLQNLQYGPGIGDRPGIRTNGGPLVPHVWP